MASIKESNRLFSELAIANFIGDKDLTITGLLSGPHGIGKTAVMKQMAKRLNAILLLADGSVLKEGEICGLPFASKTSDGSTEIRFVPHATVNQIKRMEKFYYNKLKNVGMCNGKYRIIEKFFEMTMEGNKEITAEEAAKINPELLLTERSLVVTEGKETKVVECKNSFADARDGEENKYSFGWNLTADQKMELLESGEISPIIFFFDEINRTEQQTMKELMNIILSKEVNGYKFPWYLTIVSAINPSSQNSSYSTNEMDPAQLDRFLKIKVEANISEWAEYQLSKGVDSKYIMAVAANEQIFTTKDGSLIDKDDPTQSPRGWEMCFNILKAMEYWKKSKFFTPEEKAEMESDAIYLVRGKVGTNQATQFFEVLRNSDLMINASEIFDASSNEVPAKIVAKLNKVGQAHFLIIISDAIKYLTENICKYEKGAKNSDEGKKKYANFMAQIGNFVNVVLKDRTGLKLLFIKSILPKNGANEENNTKCEDGKPLYAKIAPQFAKDTLDMISGFNRDLSSL